MGNGYVYLTSRSRTSENTGLLLPNNDDEEDSLHSSHERRDNQQTTAIYTSSAFVNGDISVNLRNVQSDDDDEIELFNKNELRTSHRRTNENMG